MHTRLAIIILHYKNYTETIACAESALAQKGEGFEILLIDNGSKDGSYQILKKYFQNTPHVTVKRLKENLGFAKGNNAGIRYARLHLSAENCFICNSDVVFEATLFEELLAAADIGVGVISPTIYNPDNSPQPLSIDTKSPYKKITFTWLYVLYKSLPDNLRRALLTFLTKKLLKLLLDFNTKLPLINEYIQRFIFYKNKYFAKKNETKEAVVKQSPSKAKHTYQIQGCAFLLTKEYFKFYDKLYPLTFLYGEELNLTLYLKKAGLKTAVASTSPVIHKGKQSSMEINQEGNDRKKLKLIRSSLFRSLPLLFLNPGVIRKIL